MTRKELDAALKKVSIVFVWVLIYGEDGSYVEVSKAAFKRALPLGGRRPRNDINTYDAVIRDNEPDALYIN